MKGKRKKKSKSNDNIIKILILLMIILSVVLVYKIVKGNKISKESKNTINVEENETTIASTNVVNEEILEKNETNTNTITNFTEETSSNEVENNTVNKKPDFTEGKLGKEGLPVLMYHFFYDESKGEKARDGNWLEVKDFEDHLKYLTENNFYFPSWEEVASYIDGEIDLPKKSVVLTVDDGEETFFETALPVIKKYDVKMTEFLVTSWNGWFKHDYPAKQVSYQSHSDNMHKGGANGKGVMTSWNYNDILNDCKNSRQVLDNEAIVFCYPFGQYTNDAKKAVKEAGFKLAFTTEAGRVKVGSDKLALPRVRTSTSTTLQVFKQLVQ